MSNIRWVKPVSRTSSQVSLIHDIPIYFLRLRSARASPAAAVRHAVGYSRKQQHSVRCDRHSGRGVCRGLQDPAQGPDADVQRQQSDEPEALVLLVACAIGICTGGGVVLFNNAIHAIQDVAWGPVLLSHGGTWARDMLPVKMDLWPLIVAPPAAGGLAVCLLQLAFGEFDQPAGSAPRSVLERASPTDAALGDARQPATQSFDPGGAQEAPSQGSPLLLSQLSEPLDRTQRQLRAMLRPAIKATAAAISLGTGASLGPEGPSVEIGKAFATGLGGALRSQRRHMMSLMAAGSGAGVAAGFNAPISGVFFAVEASMLGQQRQEEDGTDPSGLTIAMVLLASVVAAVVSQAGLGNAPAFRVPDYQLASTLELPLFLVFGILCGGVSAVSTYSTKLSTAAFKELANKGAPRAALPVLGGLITGCVAVLYPEVLYQGFSNVNAVLTGGHSYTAVLLIQILLTKIMVTSVCRGSGLVGGIYAPSIFQGATLGSAFGCIVADGLQPLGIHIAEPQVYALVGVAAMLAANCRVPLTSVLLLFELTRDYNIIIPTLLSVGLSFWAVQYCLRAIAVVASYTPDFRADARSDEARPFEVKSDTPYLSLASILMSTDDSAFSSVDEDQQQAAGAAGAGAEAAEASAGRTAASTANEAATLLLAGSRPTSVRISNHVPQAMDATATTVRELSVQCAVEDSCLVFYEDTTMEEALRAFEETGKSVGMVQGDDGAVQGVLTRESVMRVMQSSEQLPS